jgi:NTE family protein
MTVCAVALGGCATIQNAPINVPLATADASSVEASRDIPTNGDGLVVGLAFSGGGTRAAAFSYGVLSEFDRTETGPARRNVPLFDRIDYVSGVSGGAVIAAYFGLKGRAALSDFRERFLLRDAEESLRTPFTPVSVIRAYEGGVNDAQQFPQWLDKNLFGGATFKELDAAHRPRVLINASDVYNRTPFVFNDATFKAICSDLNSYPIASAVAASAASLSSSLRLCSPLMPIDVGRAFRTGLRPHKTMRLRLLCSRSLLAQSRAIAMAQYPTLSCSMVG